MRLTDLARHWDAFGRHDPFWAVLTHPDRKGGRWTGEELFLTGELEIEGLLNQLAGLQLTVARSRALDFGCGVGRATQALAWVFDEAVGVDIAPSMIKLASLLNRQGARCRYILNQRADLACFEDRSFDLVYSNLVLQHVPPRYTRAYLKEFVRLLRSGGLIVFQLPTDEVYDRPPATGIKRLIRDRSPHWLIRIYRAVRRLSDRSFPRMESHGLTPEQITRCVMEAGGRVLHIVDDDGHGSARSGYRYFVTRDR